MPRLIRLEGGTAAWADDPFTFVDDDELTPHGEIIVTAGRFQREGRHLLDQSRQIGVRLGPEDAPEALVMGLPRLAVLELVFPKFRDGRQYSAARILKERLRFAGELRAVGDVFLEMAPSLARCGFDAVQPADGTEPGQWTRAVHRYRHVYQRAADGRQPAFVEREGV
jgi:uncharacterized protein (DUF934 family)